MPGSRAAPREEQSTKQSGEYEAAPQVGLQRAGLCLPGEKADACGYGSASSQDSGLRGLRSITFWGWELLL